MFKALLSTGVAAAALMVGTVSGTTGDDAAVARLCKYISINTTNPPGNEKSGAEYLASILRSNGIDATLFDTAPGRACVYAKLPGTGKKRPIILLNHIDVVPAKAEDWQHAPFEGKVYDNEIWGRGAIDMKSTGMAELEAMVSIKRAGAQHDRDIIFLGTPDEEVGGAAGAEWMTKNHPQLVKDAEYLINEGFGIDTRDDGTPKFWGVDVAEKSVMWLRLTATGQAGHASMPITDSAPNRLARALAHVVNNPPAPNVIPSVKRFFEDIAVTEDEPVRSYFKNITQSVQEPKIYGALLKNKLLSSMLRDTVSLTVLKAGYKTNVIPAEATAELDCRLLPNTDKYQFIKQIEDKIDDPSVKVSVLEYVKADPSPYDTELFKVITDVANSSGPLRAPVVPIVVPWFTDSHFFRNFGTVAYGFMPFRIDAEHMATMHGKDERIPVKNYLEGIHLMTQIVDNIAR
ncbi:MAG TPA: M20/M25/M40 family metallo-hydrolase [Candidatus Obscuribacterales bacterium]